MGRSFDGDFIFYSIFQMIKIHLYEETHYLSFNISSLIDFESLWFKINSVDLQAYFFKEE